MSLARIQSSSARTSAAGGWSATGCQNLTLMPTCNSPRGDRPRQPAGERSLLAPTTGRPPASRHCPGRVSTGPLCTQTMSNVPNPALSRRGNAEQVPMHCRVDVGVRAWVRTWNHKAASNDANPAKRECLIGRLDTTRRQVRQAGLAAHGKNGHPAGLRGWLNLDVERFAVG